MRLSKYIFWRVLWLRNYLFLWVPILITHPTSFPPSAAGTRLLSQTTLSTCGQYHVTLDFSKRKQNYACSGVDGDSDVTKFSICGHLVHAAMLYRSVRFDSVTQYMCIYRTLFTRHHVHGMINDSFARAVPDNFQHVRHRVCPDNECPFSRTR